MAARLLLAFLTDDDRATLLRELSLVSPGLVASSGRYLQGDPRALLSDPSGLARRESLPYEDRVYLFDREQSREVVVHEQPEGPFAGWSQLDEEQSDCLVLSRPRSRPGELLPSRLTAHVFLLRGELRIRKARSFTLWAAACFRTATRLLGRTVAPSLRAGPDARRRALAGELRLLYLNRPIAADPLPEPLRESSGGRVGLPVIVSSR
jgi:hypothetical protein